MTAWAFLVLFGAILVWLALMVVAAAVVEAIGRRRLADFLRLDLGDDE